MQLSKGDYVRVTRYGPGNIREDIQGFIMRFEFFFGGHTVWVLFRRWRRKANICVIMCSIEDVKVIRKAKRCS